MRCISIHLPLTVLIAFLVGCGSGQGLRVTSIQLGRSLNADSTVANHTTRFGPRETVCLSVLTSGVGSATIAVRWMYRDRVLGEPEKKVFYRDVAATEFRLQSAGGFPEGDYVAEVFVDGTPAGTREFRVEKPR